MEEKIHEICRTIWSFFNPWRFYKFIFPKSSNSKNFGFTLVEILVVIAIIGILAAGFITILNPANHLKGSRDSKRKADLRQIQTGLELYRADNGTYPGNGSISCGGNLTNGSVTYISNIPCDPSAGRSYSYSSSGSTYTLIACLERNNDPDGAGACGSGIYYTVKNP